MGGIHRGGLLKRSNESTRLFLTAVICVTFGFFLGLSFSNVYVSKLHFPPGILSSIDRAVTVPDKPQKSRSDKDVNTKASGSADISTIYVPSNPRGAERLPPKIVVSETDLNLRRLWGDPNEDLPVRPKYLVTFTVGYDQRYSIEAAMKKFSSEDFAFMFFHYDNRTSDWDQFEWSKRAVHVTARKQSKWYLQLVKKHGLEISQPGLEPNNGLTWQMTKRLGNSEVHKVTEERPGWCSDPHLPPCAAFVEIMAPVFSRNAWLCVWHMIQNDLVHGWGLDFALRRCVEPAHEKIGVVDSQWIVHQVIPSLGRQGESDKGKAPWQGVRERCHNEWTMFRARIADADKSYFEDMGKG